MRANFLIIPAIALMVSGHAMAKQNSSGDIPQYILDECDAQAKLYGGNSEQVLAATEKLVALGVFARADFHDVKIGFCDLKGVRGPVASTSCERDTILLDKKYTNKDQGLVLNATLAHEMKHHFQHTELKNRFGENYCFSDRYIADKSWMEEEADKFSDNVAGLLFVGRPVEIKNGCDAPVSIYLEPDNPIARAPSKVGFIEVGPHSTAETPTRSMSKSFKFYAQSEPNDGRRWVWQGPSKTHKRVISGETYYLRKATLSNRSPSTGPFLLNLSCG